MKYLLQEADEAERAAVLAWLQADEQNRVYYHQLQQVWETSKALAATTSVDENLAWQRFQQRVATARAPKASRRSFFGLRAAAAVLLLVALSITIYLGVNKENPPAEKWVQTQQQVLSDSLPDGSVVTLNKKSAVAYPETFRGNTRNVTLKGEAFFKVAPDPAKPFVIQVRDVLVTVVGTSFNIRSDSLQTVVVVETGVVQVTRAGQTTTLRAGEQLRVYAGNRSAVKEAVSDQLYAYYRTKTFVCDDTPLRTLVQVLNEAYDTHIVIGRQELNDLRLNATFNNESLEQVLTVIQLTFDVQVIKKDGEVILK